MFPRRVIRLFYIKEDRHNVLSADERLAHKRLESDELISSAEVSTETALKFSQHMVAFQVPYKSVVNETLKRLHKQLVRAMGL
jgi:hypothetical protein